MRVLKIYVYVLGIKERSKFEDRFNSTSLGDYAESCVYSKSLHAYVIGFRTYSDFSICSGILCIQGWSYSCFVR